MIVDDRIIILGSANLCDRSMLGYQDTEIAVRIEDTFHLTIPLGGRNWTAGSLPHSLRMRLMKQHTGRFSGKSFLLLNSLNMLDELIDVAFHSVNRTDPFNLFWLNLSTRNSQIYDFLDGDASIYRCQRLDQYKNALKSRYLPSYLDEQVQNSVHQIEGHLVNWPLGFLGAEDISNLLRKKFSPPVHLLSTE